MTAGGCRCGAVRFTADGPPLITMACHCRGCQRMSGSAFSLSSLYPAEAFAVTEGETVRGGLKTGPDHRFCVDCMSWLYTVPEGLEQFVNIRSSLFDHPAPHRPFIEAWRAEGLPWAVTGAVRTYDTVPDDSEFPQLIGDYAAWRESGAA